MVAIDAGTTGVRSLAVGEDGEVVDVAYRELTQHFPRPGWVEHDAEEIWQGVAATLAEVAGRSQGPIAAIGVTNQRETAVVWDRGDGRPRHRAVVWQDRRTAARCRELEQDGHLPLVRRATGLVLDPYFTATKLEWLLHDGGVAADGDLACGTVDSWVVWRLTGGPDGGVHVTDRSNASRTLLYDLRAGRWSDEMCELFRVPAGSLPAITASSGRVGRTAAGVAGPLPEGTPVSGIAGDQQSSLFGQGCVRPGMAKNTYGTGSFVLVNAGTTAPEPAPGLLSTVAWQLGAEDVVFALEGSIFVTGAAVQWLRDGLGIIETASDTEPSALGVPDAEGLQLVPAFTGLGSPWWDPYARGALVGISRGTGRSHLARATVDSMAFQTRAVVDAMAEATGSPPTELRADGGAGAMDLLLQTQADLLQLPVRRSATPEATALGAAFLAGLAEGVWSSADEVAAAFRSDADFFPRVGRAIADSRHAAWVRAVGASRDWARG